MKARVPHLLKLSHPLEASFILKGDPIAWDNPWHYHPEIELLYCIKGKGTNFVGNAIQGIEEGEILLFGKNLPHTRQRDPEYYRLHPDEEPETIVVQFREDFLGPGFFRLPEFAPVHDLLIRASRGLKFTGNTRQQVANDLQQLASATDTGRVLALLAILDRMARSYEARYLNTEGYISDAHEKNAQKINQVYEFTIARFREPISLPEVAELTHLTPAAFCRYFKTRTRKTYFQYLSEVRVGYACKLLSEGTSDVGEAAFASGFNNLSNFHKQFRRITGMTPGAYLRRSEAKQGLPTT